MKKYWISFKATWQEKLEYRGDILIYTLSSSIIPFVSLAIWLAAANSGASFIFSKSEIILYFLLVILVSAMTSAWHAYFMGDDIRQGNLSRYLLKPFSWTLEYAVDNLSEKLIKITIATILVSTLGFIFLRETNVNISLTFISLSLFVLSVFLGWIIVFLVNSIMGIAAFWFHDIDFFRNFYYLADRFFSGKLIPLLFLPQTLFAVATFLPFRYTISFPIEVLMGKVAGRELLLGFVIQIIWLILLLVAYKFIYAKGLKIYQGYGG